jgi:hypothetical protein
MDPLDINLTSLDHFARDLDEAAQLVPLAQAALVNNVAFGVREEALQYIPDIMVVRNQRFLSANLRVTKATRSHLVAHLGMLKRDRFSGLEEQEFGGELDRHPASLLARGGDKAGQMRQRARLRGDIISPDDVEMSHISSEAQRLHVFLEILQRRGEKRPFILRNAPSLRPGLMQFGKLLRGAPRKALTKAGRVRPGVPVRQIRTLQKFDAKGKVRIKQTRWMKPSIDRFFARADMSTEWGRALRMARLWTSAKRM